MSTGVLLWIAIAGLLAACLTAIAARALHSFSRHELEEICQRRQTPERFSDIIRHHESVVLGAEMVVMLLLAFAVGAASLWTWQRFSWAQSQPWLAFVLAMIVFGQIIGVATVWLPWSVAHIGAARFLYATWPLWLFVGRLAKPLVWSAHAVDSLLHRVSGSGASGR